MTKDFAKRSGSAKKKKSNRRARPASPGSQRVLFHGPSFSSGAIVGALVVLVAAYAPEFLDSRRAAVTNDATASAQTPASKVTFHFEDMLRRTEVQPDLTAYPVPDPEEAAERSYALQAASFRDRGAAEQLRAELLLDNLPARVESAGAWYRVRVGPFERKVDADRAMTRLRQRGLAAAWQNNHN